MGRLDNIIARNRRPNRPSERLVVSLMLGFIVLMILVLAVFTDLGMPPDSDRGRSPGPEQGARGPDPAPDRGRSVDGVLLRRSAPAQPSPRAPSGPR